MSYPRYLDPFNDGSLDKKIDSAFKILEKCTLCGHQCKVNRLKGELGVCKVGAFPKVVSSMPHHGEEPAISGIRGSGTIFFSNCNLNCCYCQNYEFSQLDEKSRGVLQYAPTVEFEKLAELMLELQDVKVHNINFVTPTHFLPQILKSLKIAIEKGLHLPLVYNTSGYETPEAVKLLDGLVDIYLPDMRYSNLEPAKKYSSAPDYPEINRAAIKEMFRQVGDAEMDEEEIIKTGLIIRLLVLPKDISGTVETLNFIHDKISPHTYISLMSQYYPYFRAKEFPEINRRVSREEYALAVEEMKRLNLNGWVQEDYGLDSLAGVNIIKLRQK